MVGGVKAYARWRAEKGLDGGTPPSVRKAIATSRITRDADGQIDFEQADRDWAANTAAFCGRPLGGRTPAPPKPQTPPVKAKSAAKAAKPAKVKRVPVTARPPAESAPSGTSSPPQRAGGDGPSSGEHGPVTADIRRAAGVEFGDRAARGDPGDSQGEDSCDEFTVDPLDSAMSDESTLVTSTMQASRASRELWKARQAKLDYEHAAKLLLPTHEVRQMVLTIGRMHAAAREQAPGQLATELVMMEDPKEIERIIRDFLRSHDARVAKEITDRYGDVLDGPAAESEAA